MGRRKELAAINRLNGNPGRRAPDPGISVEAEGAVLQFEHLPDDARACVEIIVGSMPPGVYASVDSYLLAAFAMAWSAHKRAAFEVGNPQFEHLVNNAAGNLVPNGWLAILNVQARLLASLGDRLGLNPKARALLKLPDERPKSKFESLLGTEEQRHLNS